MADITSTRASVRAAFRDFRVDGVPASGEYEPDKSEIRGALADKMVDLIADVAASAVAGRRVFATMTERDAWSDRPSGAVAYVEATGETYRWSGTAWEAFEDPTVAAAGRAEAAAERAEANFAPGANLYNPAGRQIGRYVISSGTIVSAAGWSCTDWISVTPGQQITISSNAARRWGLAFFDAYGSLTGLPDSYVGSGSNPLTVTVPAGATHVVANVQSDTIPEPSEIMINVGSSALPFEPWAAARYFVRADAISGAGPTSAGGRLILTGVDGMGFVESDRSGSRIRVNILPYRSRSLTTPASFGLLGESIDGVLSRAANDEIAPDHVESATIGANHGYTLGRCSAAGHGKTSEDEGSVWSTDGTEYVLVKVESASSLLVARRLSNAAPPTGAYTHVSGAVAAEGFTVTSVTAIQWYSPLIDHSVRAYVDGALLAEVSGNWSYRNDVTFVETGGVLARRTIIEWWISNGGASGGEVTGDPLYTMSTAYRFDRDGQLTISRDWVFLRPTSVTDLMGLQVARLSAPDQYVVPGSLPISYDGSALDYSLGVSSGRTLSAAGTPSVVFGPADFQDVGECGHRVLSLWADAVLAVGLLPLGDAAYDVRRSRVSNRVLEIRGNTAKVYFRVLDKGVHTAGPGDHYSVIGYRAVTRRSADRTAYYVVRPTDREAWIYADWNDRVGIDRLDLPPDLQGRSLTVMDSANVTVLSGALTSGAVTVSVDAADGAAYVVLRAA